MDFVKFLPVEVTELIMSFVDGNDILRCCKVCTSWNDAFDNERTWRLLSRQRGWLKEDSPNNMTWHDHYWLNYNWRNSVYKKHHQIVTEGGGLQVAVDQQFVVISHVMGLQIYKYSIDHDPPLFFHQSIYCDDFHFQTKICGKSIVIKLKNAIHIHTQDDKTEMYKLTKIISTDRESKHYDPDVKLESAILQTGCDRLTVVQKEIKGHKIMLWNLQNGMKCTSFYLEDGIKHVFKIVLFNYRLYLVTLYQNEYRIRIHDLKKEYYSCEVVAFKNVAFGVIPPELQVNNRLMVAFCPTDIGRDLCYSYSPLKIWDSDGQVIGSVILNPGRIDYFSFCLSDDLVIYRNSQTSVKVWKPEMDQEVCRFDVEPEICQINTAIGNLLVLSYECYFDVWDYSACCKLYRVPLIDSPLPFVVHSAVLDKISINKYYYVKQDRNKKTVTILSYMNQIEKLTKRQKHCTR